MEVPSDTFPQYLLVFVPSPILDSGSLYVLGGCALVLVAWVCARGLPRCLKRLQKLWAMCDSVVLQTVVRLCMDIVDQNLDVSVA